jgi:hypothetical protein
MYTCTLEVVVTAVVVELAGDDGTAVVAVDGVVACVVVETGVATAAVVVVVVVSGGEDAMGDSVVTGAGEAGARLPPGTRAAAAVRFNSPTVMPVTESWTGVADC